jgi:hypothetical protein
MREMRVKNNQPPNTDYSGSQRPFQLPEERLATCPEFSETIAEFTLRAGGRKINVAMLAHGGTTSHMEICSSKHLSREQWMQLWDNIQVITHSMILLDHPEDNG